MSLLFTALVLASTSFAGTATPDTDASDNVAVALGAADPYGDWRLLPIGAPSTTAARAKADILVDALRGDVFAAILDESVLKLRPFAVLSSTGQGLVAIEPDEIDFSEAFASLEPDEIDLALRYIDPDECDGDLCAQDSLEPDEIDVYSMLKMGTDWLVVNKDGSAAGVIVHLAE